MPRYVVRPAESTVHVGVRSSLHALTGRVAVSGYLDVQLREGRLDLGVPPVGELQLRVVDIRSEQPVLDRELHRRLDADRYPLVRAVLRDVAASDDGSYRMTGDLTIRGRAVLVAGTAQVDAVDEAVTLRGELRMDVRDFGIEPPRLLMLKISPEVDVRLDLVAVVDAAD